VKNDLSSIAKPHEYRVGLRTGKLCPTSRASRLPQF
jgi:hypothetical protein